jgi:GNAT superfamily N-acetyltransferase
MNPHVKRRPIMSYTIREATPADAPAIARLHVETFIETHGGADPPTVELRERQWREILGKGEPVGFARGVPNDPGDPEGYAGVLNKIYLLKRHHRRGLGRRLLGHVARRFLKQGVTSMRLFGDADSPTNGFYERMGAERTYSDAGEFHGGYGWRDLERLAADCPDG